MIMGVILILYQASINGIRLTRHARNQEIALRIAQHKLENLRFAGYAALPSTGAFNDTRMADLPNGTGMVTISEYNTKTKHVKVSVNWLESGSTSGQSLSVDTLITEIGGLK